MGYFVPVPASAREVADRFASIWVGAPDFAFLNKAVVYDITLDMMMESQRLGIQNLIRRTRRAEAKTLFQQCLEQLDEVHRLYREEQVDEARRMILEVGELFDQACEARSTPKD